MADKVITVNHPNGFKGVLFKMKLAEFGTYENVTTIIETIEDMADKIIEQME